MLDIGWSELLVIAVVLIVVVGPKDLPPMLRAFGKMTTNLRRMAGEFRTQFDEALRESDMDDVRKTIADAKSLNPANSLRDALNPIRQMGEDIRSDLSKVTLPPVSSTDPVVETDRPATESGSTVPETSAADVAMPAAVQPAAVPQAAASTPVAEVKPAPAAPVAAATDTVQKPVKAKTSRKPKAQTADDDTSAKKVAAKPRKTPSRSVDTTVSDKKVSSRKKKTTEPGKDQA